MSKNSQAATQGPEQEEKGFINEFSRMNQENVIRGYEQKHRQRIMDAPALVKFSFDEQWKKVTGNNYFQPQTTIQAPVPAYGKNITERSNPKSRDYRTRLTFSSIKWQKIRRRISKRFRDLYILSGLVDGAEAERPIYQNLTLNRLKELLGEDNADKIIEQDKKKNHGEITGSFELEVEGYWEIQFAPKKDKNDPPDVRLTWEGQTLIIQRMKPVVLPGFYLEVADNATRDHYIQNPKQGRKKIGVIQEYPYTVLREAIREEFLEQKEAGDKVMRDIRKREDGEN